MKKALLVGINYVGSSCELNGCINDVENVKKVLISKYTYQSAYILMLTDNSEFKPTADNIREGFKWLLSDSPANHFRKRRYTPLNYRRNLYFHYSGHGSQITDTNNDEADGKDEVICPVDFQGAGMISDDEIREQLVLKIPSGYSLKAIIDACHSASSFDLLWNCGITEDTLTFKKISSKISPTSGNILMISGCKDEQTSADVKVGATYQGALTYSILKVLEANNYAISWDRLLMDTKKCIVDNKLSDQIPCLSIGKFCDITDKVDL